MESIVGVNQTSQSDVKTSLNQKSTMGKDDFLKLLVVQMKNQDPMNPMKNTEFAAQLAQFSSLESLNNLNETVQNQYLMSQSMNNSFMTNMIGKDVKAYGNSVELSGDKVDIQFNLVRDASTYSIKVMDENGKTIKTINGKSLKAGDKEIEWDGTNDMGTKVEKGTYTFSVEALDGNSMIAETTPYMTGYVKGIAYNQGTPYLVVNGGFVNLGDIISVLTHE